MLNKKGGTWLYFVILFFFMALGFFFARNATAEKSPFTFNIGDKTLTLTEAVQQSRADMSFVFSAAELSFQETLFDIAEEGGLLTKECGIYNGYTQWTSEHDTCFPTKKEIHDNIMEIYQEKAQPYFEDTIYNYFLNTRSTELELHGIALQHLQYNIIGSPDRKSRTNYAIDDKPQPVDSNTNQITAAVLLLPQEKQVGAYSFKPSYKIKTKRNIIKDFEEIVKNARTIQPDITACENDPDAAADLETCAETALATLTATTDYTWTINCGEEIELDKTLPICVQTQESHFIYNKDQNKIVNTPVTIKFALYFT